MKRTLQSLCKISLLFLLYFTCFTNTAKSQNLVAGDMVVLGINAVADKVIFATLVDIPAGTVIKITDKGWNQATASFVVGFDTGDGVTTWTTASNISAGTILTLTLGGSDNNPLTNLNNVTAGNINLTANISVSTYTIADPIIINGEQIFIYQGDANNPYFIFGLNASRNNNLGPDFWQTVHSNGQLIESMLPNGVGSQNALTNGVNAVGILTNPTDTRGPGFQQFDNVVYIGPTAVTDRAGWLARITDRTNWSGDDTGVMVPSVGVGNGSKINITAEVTKPIVATTTPATAITPTSAVLGGSVTADGGATVTERGIVWGTTANPTTANNKVTNGSGTGIFSQTVSGLPSGTVIYYRAYAINSVGTAYGDNERFNTLAGGVLLSSNPTLTFTNNTGLGDFIANDGEGGSTAISDIDIEIYEISDVLGTRQNTVLWKDNDFLYSNDPNYSGLTTEINPASPLVDQSGSKGTSIKSSDGSEFKLISFRYYNWGESESFTNTIKGYRDGMEVASTTFQGFDETYDPITVTLPATFSNVDEVRMYISAGGYVGDQTLTNHSINEIKLGSPVISSNTAPTITTSDGITSFTEGTPIVIDNALTVADADNTTLASATVSITGGFQSGQDVLAFTNSGSIATGNIAIGSNNEGVLTLTSEGATATLSQWQEALRAVTYNSSVNPNTINRTVSFIVNDGTDNSIVATKTVSVTARVDNCVVSAILTDVGNEGANDYAHFGQSFTACQSGTLSKIKFLSRHAGSLYPQDLILTIRQGNGLSGSILGTVTVPKNSIVEATSGTDFTVADVSDLNISVTSGNYYTFSFEGEPGNQIQLYFGKVVSTSPEYIYESFYTGGNMYVGGSAHTDKDLVFEVEIGPASISNVAPTATNLTQSISFTEDDASVALNDIVVTDPDAGETITATLTLSNPDAGSLTTGSYGSATSTYDAGAGAWTVTASVADVNLALAAVAFTPATSWDQDFTINTRIRDAANNGPADGTISVTVTPANHAPILSGGPYVLPMFPGIPQSPAAWVSGMLFGSNLNYSDADTDALSGIAITASIGSGTWEYSTDGTTWYNVGAVSNSAALLLSSDSYFRYTPGSVAETATLTFQGWDQTSGTATVNDSRGVADVTTNGGNTAFSNGTAQASVTVASLISPDVNGILYVRKGSTGESGSDWSNALGELADALKAAKTNTDIKEIWVAEGVYKPLYRADDLAGPSTTDRDNAFVLVGNVKVYGGFMGTESSTENRDWINHKTVLSGDLDNSNSLSAGDAYHVLVGVSWNGVIIDNNVVIDGFTVSGGNANGTLAPTVNGISLSQNSGGGLSLIMSSPTISNMIFEKNNAYNGGAISNYNTASPSVERVSFVDNTATGSGGAIVNAENSSPVLIDVEMRRNSASSTGGAMANVVGSNPALTNVLFADNNAGMGGAMYNYSSNPVLTNVTIAGNTATTAGAGVYNDGAGIFKLNNSILSGNNINGDVSSPSASIYNNGAGVQSILDYSLVVPMVPGGSPTSIVADPLFTDAANGNYTLLAGSPAIDAGNNALFVGLDANTKDLAGNERVQGIVIDMGAYEAAADVTAPVVLSTSVPANGTYKAGDNLTFTINLNESVTVNTDGGTPRIALTIGSSTVYASYTEGSESSALVFSYTIQPGDLDADGITLGTALELNGGTIRDAAGNNATLALNSVGSTTGVLVDAVAPTVIITSNVSFLKIGETATVTFTFSEDPSTTFTAEDIVVSGGTLTAFLGSGTSHTATFEPVAGVNNGIANITIAAGSYSDAAGNPGGEGETPTLTFDTQAPDAPSAPSMAAGSDSGASNSDQITNVTTPTFTGTAEEGSTVTLYDTDGVTVLGIETAADGIWSITSLALAEGSHTLTATAKDGVGNISIASSGLEITIDNTAPAKPIGLSASFGELENMLNWTANNETDLASYRVFGGTSVNPTSFLSTRSKSTVTYTHRALTNGVTYYYRIMAVDLAGNASEFSEEVDATPKAPQVITFDPLPIKTYGDADFDGGASSTNNSIAITYSSSDETVATIVNGKIHVIGVGTTDIKASQAGSEMYTPATEVIQTLTINKAELTVTADAKSKVYGTTDPELTYQVTGLVRDDEETVVSGNLTRTAGENVGDYAISNVDLTADNYDISYVGADLVINKAGLTVTADAKSKVYGTTDPELTYQVAGLVRDDEETVVSGNLTRAAGEDVGDYAISNVDLTADNYDISYVGADLVINKAGLTVTADAKSKVYGTTDPELTYQVAGLVRDDEETVVSGNLTRVAGENVGDYAISNVDLTADNYDISYVGADLVINKAGLTVTADAKSKVYGTTDPELTYQVTGLVRDDEETVVSGNLTRAAGEDVGDYAINNVDLTASNYDITYVGADLTINRAGLTVTADAKSKVYGATDPALTYEVTGLANNDNAAVVSGNLTRTAGENVGSYAINNVDLTADNYDITYVGADLTISKAALTVTADAKSKVYGTADPVLTYEVTGLVNNDAATVVSGSLSRTAGENVGSYAINNVDLTADNYDITYVGADLTISKAALTVTADAKQKVYGTADPALTYQVTGLVNNDNATVVSGSLTRAAGENVGSYAINNVDLTASNYDITYVGAELTINRAALTVTADAKSKVYGATDPALTYEVTGLANNDNATVVSGNLTRTAGENVGNYAISNVDLTASNYDITYVGADLTINKAGLTVTADAKSKVYGTTDPTLTYEVTGLVNNDNATVVSGNLTRTAGENVGNYAINNVDLTASNYNITYVGADLTINRAGLTVTADAKSKVYGTTDPALTYQVTGLVRNDAATVVSGSLTRAAGENVGNYTISNVDLTASNYDITYVGADLTINKAGLTVTADAKSKVYGTTDPALTYQVTGLVRNDAATVVSGSLTRAAGENVGNYTISNVDLTASNYDITYVGADLTINKAGLTVTADAKSKVYGETDPALTYEVSGLVNNDASTVVSGSLTRAIGENVGNYAISNVDLTASNYDITYVGADLTINKAGLTVTADAKSKVYGTADPALTYQVSGLVRNDAATVVSGSLTRTTGENVGNYAISNVDLTASNYDITYVGADLTINKAALTVTADAKSKVYGETDPALTYEVSGLVNNDASTVVSGSLTRAIGENVGSYAINNVDLAADNYDITYVGADLTINKAGLTVTADAKSKVYGTIDPALTYQVTGLVRNDAATVVSGSLTRAAGENVGNYTINNVDLSAANYSIQYVGATFVITKAKPVITFPEIQPVYRDAGILDLAISSTGPLPIYIYSDNILVAEVTGETEVLIKGVGLTTITAEQPGNANYEDATPVTRELRVRNDDEAILPVRVHQAVSPNGDGINEYLRIEGIDEYPENKITIFDGNGNLVREIKGYNNHNNHFDGIKESRHVPSGTYFYVLEVKIGNKWHHDRGFFVVRY